MQNTYALLVMLQEMDTARKDGTIQYVMSGVNPLGAATFLQQFEKSVLPRRSTRKER